MSKEATTPSAEPSTRLQSKAEYAATIEPLYRKMVERLLEKSTDLGTTWREVPFSDGVLLPRLRRAVDHLEAALHANSKALDPDVLKRAADVANLAMMAADPQRDRGMDPDVEDDFAPLES